MSGAVPAAPGLDGTLDRLERVIGRLADPAAPLERLVADYEEAGKLVEDAQRQLDAAAARVALAAPDPQGPRS